MTARALAAPEGYVSRMADRVAHVLEITDDFTLEEQEELIEKLTQRAEREHAASDARDDETGEVPDATFAEELGRRLRAARASGTTGEPAGPFLAELKASLRAKSA